MKTLAVILTENCPRNCTYCYGAGKAGSVVDANPNTVARVAADLKATHIAFTGGEPLSRPALLIKTVKTILSTYQCYNLPKPKFHVTTGGADIAEDDLAPLKPFGLTATLSLDGPPHINDKQRGEGSYECALNALRILRAIDIQVGTIRATLSPEVFPVLPMREALEHLGCFARACVVKTVALQVAVNGAFDAVIPLKEALLWYVGSVRAGEKPFWREAEKMRQAILAAPKLRVLRHSCGAVRGMLALDPSGNLWPCHRRSGEPVGNLAGVNPRALSDWWARILDSRKKCIKCPIWSACLGGCPAEDKGGKPRDAVCALRLAMFYTVKEILGEYGRNS